MLEYKTQKAKLLLIYCVFV